MKSTKLVRAPRLPSDYAVWLMALKERVRSAQLKAAVRVNRELILLYWDIGRSIAEAQRDRGYGKQVVERLAGDLQLEFPGLAGFSSLNVWRMRAFYEAYAGGSRILSQAVTESASALAVARPGRQSPRRKLSQLVTELAGAVVLQPAASLGISFLPAGASIVQPAVGLLSAGPPEPMASLPWGHNLLLLHKLKLPAERLWYAQAAVVNGWSRAVLGVQIEQRAHRRVGKAVTNFAVTLPPPQSDLAQQTLKDPYVFDSEPSQKTVLDFYLSAVDDQMRHRDDQPSIGLLLCRGKNRLTVEYALRDVKKPIGVAEWRTRLVDSLPKKLRGSLPTVAEIEAELGNLRKGSASSVSI